MKIRSSIFLFIAIVVALMLWHGRKKPTGTPTITAVETNVVPSATTAPSAPVNAPVHRNTPPTQLATNAAMPSNQTKGEPMKEGLAEMNDVPIVFYGRLADQFDSPVVGAQIDASVRIYNGVQSTVNHLKTLSDGNGFFQIQGGKGESLGIMPKKAGYVLAATDTYFKYSYMYPDRFSPDPNNPTLIKMWKLQGAEPLVSINQEYKLHYTGSPINFDLVAGKIVPTGGDIRITVNRSAGEVSEHNPQDWSVQVEAVNGGLIETTVAESRATYAAPEDGYQPTAAFEMSTAAQSWHAAVDQMFFLESRNGKVFSKVRLILGINETPDGLMDITFSGVANTNSSRNWEATVPQ
ncbi:MAG: hypothetical protein ACREDS_00110 [Limisphaerales bacterium]